MLKCINLSMKRMHLKKNKNKKIIFNKIIIFLILLFISIIYILKIFNDKSLPQLKEYSTVETSKIISSLINSTVIQEISSNINMENLFITTKDNNGNIKSIDFNSMEVNKILVQASESVEQNLKYLERGEVNKINIENFLYNYDKEKLKKGIIYELPSGLIFNNVLFNNLFPKIPIKISVIGNVYSKLITDVIDYGINNALLKVNINIEVELKILLPFVSENKKFNVDVPIIMKVLEGNVPSYYYGGYLDTIVNK